MACFVVPMLHAGQPSRLSNMQTTAASFESKLEVPSESSHDNPVNPVNIAASQPHTSSVTPQRSSIIVSKSAVPTAYGIGHAVSTAAGGSLSSQQGLLSKVPLSGTHDTKSWKLQYSFCTPVEKKLQQQLEVRILNAANPHSKSVLSLLLTC